MNLFSASALLAAAALSLAGVGATDPVPVCGTEQPLIVDGKDFGHFKITDRNGGLLTVEVNVAGQDLTVEEEISFPYITEVRAQTCCSMEGETDTGHSPLKITRFHDDDYTIAKSNATFMIQEPDCPEGWATDIKIQADIEEPGGIIEFNGLFPVDGIDVKFKVEARDRGDGTLASYFDASFEQNNDRGDTDLPDILKDKYFDGYCVDAGTIIYTNYWYNAKAYSFLNQDWDKLGARSIGNIDKPWMMDNVAYCINHWHEGTTYPNPNPTLYPNAASSYKVSSGTMQTVIWQLVDDQVNDLGDSADLNWAKIIYDDCLANGGGFEPGCNDAIPLVIVPVYTNSNDYDFKRQNQYVQTTFAQLGITCHGATGTGQAHAACMPGGSGESGGDPHFKTFGNEWFDFHGGCDLLLADFPAFSAGLGLTAEVRTTTRYDYSFIEGAAIKIGEDILEIFSYGQYMLNGIAQAEAPLMIGDFPVGYTQPRKHQHLFSIDLGDEKNIVIKVYKDLVYITLNVQDGRNTEFLEGTGMLGSWFNGTRFARDGATVMLDNNEYGQEWQVRDTDQKLFSIDRAPQWPVQCEMPKAIERASRRLGETGVSAEEASTACAHIKNQHKRDMCVFDVIATSDLSVAQGGSY